MQIWNVYRSRAIGNWLEKRGVQVIPNIRFSDSRTWKLACLGVKKGGIIAVGTHGCLKGRDDRAYFVQGLDAIIEQVKPRAIIVYGTALEEIFGKYSDKSINIVHFVSEYASSRKEVI